MREKIIESCKKWGADLVGFAPIDRFCADSAVRKLMPEAKTVIGLGFRVLRGTYRGIEEGSTYYQYTTMGVENMEETVMPMVQVRLSMYLEEEGYLALPQRRHQQIMAESDSTNPEVAYDSVYRGCTQETQMNFSEAAVLCGLGEIGMNGAILTDEFGPFVRCCFVITDAELEPTPVKEKHLCDRCGKCIKACPGGAISENGELDPWQCAVYYNGANGTKNPFMPPDAFADFENRMDIIGGRARVDKDTAPEILQNIYFYPPAQHAYQCSICGRACDMSCYVHLEEKGALTKAFKLPFRRRSEWKFSEKDFE
ncbi:MAG: 4Fe-4S binding protein [Clostridia bacterium]|nr:4Fe-4S binding protein [Clostridia bacterium]